MAKPQDSFVLGVVADCQYADQADKGSRLYTTCPAKLTQAVNDFNTHSLVSVIHLGDFIDKDFTSFATVLDISKALNTPFYHVLGNHEFSVDDQYKMQIATLLNMPARYYSFDIDNWVFIALDGNDVSTYAWPKTSEKHQQNMALYASKYSAQKTWNGAIGEEQLAWLKQQLDCAHGNNKNVVLLSHFPVYPEDQHNLWNSAEVLAMIDHYPNVKAWFNGHNHVGNYGLRNGVHFVTFNAMLDTPETAYSLVEFSKDNIKIEGVGKQPSMVLSVK